MLLGRKKSGIFFCGVTRYINNAQKETIIMVTGASIQEVLLEAIRKWKEMNTPKQNATQQLFDWVS